MVIIAQCTSDANYDPSLFETTRKLDRRIEKVIFASDDSDQLKREITE